MLILCMFSTASESEVFRRLASRNAQRPDWRKRPENDAVEAGGLNELERTSPCF